MARGNLVSYQLDELVKQAKAAFADGCRELWLTSEDLGAWGRDIGMVRFFLTFLHSLMLCFLLLHLFWFYYFRLK